MAHSIPIEMKALQIETYHHDATEAIQSLKVVTKPTPKPGPGQVLVKIEAAPCNPSDILFLQNRYGVSKTLPAVPGWEGAGTVVASGGGLIGMWLKGKRVACGGQADRDGTWAEYYIADANACIPLKDEVSFEQGATLIINPLTAVGMLEEAKRGKHSAIIQTGAASQVGRMVLRLAKEAKIPAIHIVRRQEQVDLLKKLGGDVVLNSEEEGFRKELHREAKRLKATIAFDAVAGSLTGELLSAMPKQSKILVYGALSLAPCSGISPLDLIFQGKNVEGFWLSKWLVRSGFWGTFKATNLVQGLMAGGSFETAIRAKVGFDDLPNALLEYQNDMTAGKVLLYQSN